MRTARAHKKAKVAKRRRALPALLFATALLALALLPASPASAAVPSICKSGTAAGRCENPRAVAVDQSSGDVYVADSSNNRIDEFDSTGNFLRAFGFGVLNGAKELETCTTLCTGGLGSNGGPGKAGPLPGALTPIAITVDPTSHDVYAFDAGESRVEKYTAAGSFLWMIGGGVDKGPHHPGNLCTVAFIAEGDTCGAGSTGSGAGQFSGGGDHHGLAVDSSGHLWVGDMERVEEFSEGGTFGSEVTLPGAGEVASLAIDTDPLSPSFEDFYTLKPFVPGHDERQLVTPVGTGEYTLSFGGFTTKPISNDAQDGVGCQLKLISAQSCPIAAALQELPSIGVGNVLSFASEVIFTGALADTNVEQMTASAGVTVETKPNQQGKPETPGVLAKRKPNGEALETIDAGGEPTAVAVDPANGEVFVADQFEPAAYNRKPATLLSYSPSGVQVAALGTGEVIGGPTGNALAFGSTAQRLYVASSAEKQLSAVQPFPLPAPGPLPVGGSANARPIQKLGATLCSRVNPEHAETKAHFQYIPAATYEADGNSFGAGTLETSESGSLGADFSFNHELCQPISSLQPAAEYRFRLVAKNSNGTVKGETTSFETLPPAAIDSTSSSGVSADAANLEAEINPLGDATTYSFEYLTEEQAEENEAASEPPFTGAAQAPLQATAIGAGSADVAVSQHLQGLATGTAYRYRVVVRNVISEAHGGPFAGAAHTFTTQLPSVATLPDQRAWEQVSPPDKHGASLKSQAYGGFLVQAADNGDALAYVATAPTEAETPGYSSVGGLTVLGGRGAGGWASRDLTPPHTSEVGVILGNGDEYHAFSSDLSLSIAQPFGPFEPQISPAASEQTAFLRTDFAPGEPSSICANGEGCYRPLVTGCPSTGECPAAVEALADVPAGTKFGFTNKVFAGPAFVGATPDLSHVVLETTAPVPLLSGAPASPHVLYEWSASAPHEEALRLVSVLPGGVATGEATVGFRGEVIRNAISSDGSRVVFEVKKTHLYLRYNATEPQSAINGLGECTEAEKACTIQLDAIKGGVGASQPSKPVFQDVAADGSRVFFTDTQQLTPDSGGESRTGGNDSPSGGDLYECRIVTGGSGAPECELSDLTPETGGEAAGVQGLVPGISADGGSVYFVADGVLTGEEENARGESALPGSCERGFLNADRSCNLYLHRGNVTRFVAVLSEADRPDWEGQGNEQINRLPDLTSRVSPNGRRLAFMSQRSLTGYDNRDAVSGERDEEVFLYDAGAEGEEGTLVCASCNPSGARPHGVEFKNLAQAHYGSWEEPSWLAANVPGWAGYDAKRALHQPRYLSDSGRLFFNSSDALVPQDVNGQEDVYEYEPPQSAEEAPPNDSCTTSSPTYSPASQGCVNLISSGTSSEESAFLDASETGNDVFFLTTSKLVPQDTDSSLDVYDARAPHVPGEQVGFPEALKPVECTGDACQSPATPPSDPTPGSLTFQGAGNVKEEAPTQTRCAKGKVRRAGKCVAKKKHKAKAKRKRATKSQRRAGR